MRSAAAEDGAPPPGSRLYAEGLAVGYEERTVVDGLDLRIPDGSITALVGPNGSGKSTLLLGLARILRPRRGAVYLDGKAIHQQPTREVARRLAILPQGPEAPEGLSVEELVAYGRFPYQHAFGSLGVEDRQAIRWALRVTGTEDLSGRPVGALSGGQRQRAWIAMALAQGTKLLLLDEPTTFLDVKHQLEVLQLLQRLNRDEGRTVVLVIHDLNHAARFAHRLVVVDGGRAVAEGPPADVVTPALLREVFGVEADVVRDARSGAPLCLPYGLASHQASGTGGDGRDGAE
ncbi:MAG TPA: ABC transporter ATP-binding protein, partial [Chloroflexota bacterium]|nr:ABC transporter ATP-binding protein [Chloroflexota bacterium]